MWATTAQITGLSTQLTGLLEGTVYQWRVKSSCSTYSSTATFNSGGGGGNTECSQPSNLTAANLSGTSVQLSWTAIAEAFNYRVQHRVLGTTTWTTSALLTTPSLTLTGLLDSTEYQWRVKASCSVYSSIAVFNTAASGGGTSCSAPSNTNTVLVTPTSANVAWEAVAEATDYTVEYKLLSASAYTSAGTFTVASATISGLTPGQQYVWRVKANCSPWGSDVGFSTPLTKPTGGKNFESAERSIQNSIEFSIFPNPARGGEVLISTENAGGFVQILDAAGRSVLTQNLTEQQENLNISNLKSGIYFVRLQQENFVGKTLKLVVAQ